MASRQLSPYEQFRLERIKRNEERLANLGLIDAKKNLFRATAEKIETTTRRQPSTPGRIIQRSGRNLSSLIITPSPSRSSRRLTHKPVQFQPMSEDNFSHRIARQKIKEIQRRPKTTTTSKKLFKFNVPMDVSSSSLSSEEKETILKKMEGGDFLGKFEDYLTNVDTLSYQNKRNVLRQITKLAMGEGIRYESKAYGWPDGCLFLGGIKVGPTDDILKLMDLGRECEKKWGEDRGNGWLLSHPLKKMYMFQQYLLQE